MPLTPQDVAHKVFGPTRLRRGYNENEVDAFLDLVEAELTRLTEENASLRSELEQGRGAQRLGAGGTVIGSGPTGSGVIGSGSAGSAPVGASASREVAVQEPPSGDVERITRTLVLAQRTADQALEEARQEAEAILKAAQREAQDELTKAERAKARLDGEVDSLRTFEREYRSRLRAYLQVQLKELESDTGESGVAVDVTDVDALDTATPTPPPFVSLRQHDEAAVSAGPSGPPASVRLPSDIEDVPSSLFRPPVLVGATASGGTSNSPRNGAGEATHAADAPTHGATGPTHAAAQEPRDS